METNISNITSTNLNTSVSKFSVKAASLDQPSAGESYYDFPNARQQLGYYKSIPELKKAIDALAIWSVAQGYTTDTDTQVILDHITGWGEDSFLSIIKNMIIQKKIFGDAFAEVIKSDNTIINLKPLFPGDMRIVVGENGIIKRYEHRGGNNKVTTFKPEEILHLCNDRIGDEIHGTSVIDACKWVIDARNEAMNDWRRISHRSTIRVMYIDADNTSKLQSVKNEYATAINKGELMLIPAKRGEAEFQDLEVPSIANHLQWIQYLENFFYQAVGVPRVIATSENYTEAASKVGFLTFEPIYTSEQVELESDLWNKLILKVKFNRPPSLSGMLQDSEAKNTGQTGFQLNEVQPSITKNE